MSYFVFFTVLCMVLGFIGVASNPSPVFGAMGLVVSALGGSVVLVIFGGSFIALVLFLIYLGGMLVVFAYSVALSADQYPEVWLDYSVLYYVFGYFMLVLFLVWYFGGLSIDGCGASGGDDFGFEGTRTDFSGVALMYSLGGPLLLLCGGSLMVALFVVLELTRGSSFGGLRAV